MQMHTFNCDYACAYDLLFKINDFFFHCYLYFLNISFIRIVNIFLPLLLLEKQDKIGKNGYTVM